MWCGSVRSVTGLRVGVLVCSIRAIFRLRVGVGLFSGCWSVQFVSLFNLCDCLCDCEYALVYSF